MLSTQPFSDSDLRKVQALPKSFKLSLYLFIILCVPLSLLVGLTGLLRKGYGFWLTTIIALLLQAGICIAIFLKNYTAYRKDISRQIKLVGEVVVTSKSEKRNETIIKLNNPELSQIDIHSKHVFDQISAGDTLTIEISKFSKYLLNLEKKGQSLYNGY